MSVAAATEVGQKTRSLYKPRPVVMKIISAVFIKWRICIFSKLR
jgi:hypothetical protein